MADKINMAAYARMLSGLDPMQDEPDIEPMPANDEQLTNGAKTTEDRRPARLKDISYDKAIAIDAR